MLSKPTTRKENLIKASTESNLVVEPVTNRELEVLRLIAEGLSNQEIAEHLVISIQTVKRHAFNLYGKLGVKRRTQAIVRAKALALL